MKNLKKSSTKHRQWERDEKRRQGLDLIEKIKSIKDCGIGKRFKEKTFDSFDKKINQEAYSKCLSFAKGYIDNLKRGKGIIITGRVGTGKTHLAVAIVDYIARMYKKKVNSNHIHFASVVDMISDIKRGFKDSSSETRLKKYEDVALLILDDFGANRSTEWEKDIMYRIINYRYQELKPIIITTNLNFTQLMKLLDERIFSRLFEMNEGVNTTGEDYRLRENC